MTWLPAATSEKLLLVALAVLLPVPVTCSVVLPVVFGAVTVPLHVPPEALKGFTVVEPPPIENAHVMPPGAATV